MTVSGTYGTGTPCDVFVYETRQGNWYCVEGSKNVNCTFDEISDGVDVECLYTVDVFTWNKDIDSYEELVEAVDFTLKKVLASEAKIAFRDIG